MERNAYVSKVSAILANATRTDVKEEVIQEYIDNWQANKNAWVRRLGNQTIYTYPDPITIENTSTIDALLKFLREVRILKYQYTFSYKDFEKFIEAEKDTATDNLVSIEYTCPDGTVIPKGMRLLRAFRYFFPNKDELNKVQDMMNLIISQAKFKGYLHISVDPLDYLSSSENNYGWRSCHALDGDYSAGNIEYMMDKHTLVCYIDDNTEVQLHNFPEGIKWNNKKWRMLLFISEDGCTVFAGRQYPFTTNAIWEPIRECLMHFFPLVMYGSWSNTYFSDTITNTDDTIQVRLRERHVIDRDSGYIYPLGALYSDTIIGSHTFYDDILYSNYYLKPFYLFGRPTYKYRSHSRVNTGHISVGYGYVTCPTCGQHELYRGEGWDCENFSNDDWFTCECCGRSRLEETEGAWLIDDQWWCNDCIDNNAVICSRCGELCNIENAICNEETGEYLCPNCYEEDKEWQ